MIGTISLWAKFEDQFAEVQKIEKELTAILVLGEFEFDYTMIEGSKELFNKTVSYANSLNIPVYVTTGLSTKDANLLPINDTFYKNVTILYWPTYWLTNAYDRMHLDYINEPNLKLGYDIDKITTYDSFQYSYLSMNNMAHTHRCLLMDALAKYDIIQEGKISWRKLSPFHFKHWKQEHLIIDQEGAEQTPLGLSREKMPECYRNTFLQVVPESDYEKFTLSMSTAVPLFLCKPFLPLGCQYFTDMLSRYGFQKYDEVFDYSYDNIERIDDRVEALAKEIKRICGMKPQYPHLSRILRKKLVHNREVAIRIATDFNNFPNIWKQVAEQSYIPVWFNKELYPAFKYARIKRLYEKFKLS